MVWFSTCPAVTSYVYPRSPWEPEKKLKRKLGLFEINGQK